MCASACVRVGEREVRECGAISSLRSPAGPVHNTNLAEEKETGRMVEGIGLTERGRKITPPQ